jgi:hypothetical protein
VHRVIRGKVFRRPCLRQRGFEEHQFEQIRIVEVLGIAFAESHRGEFGLLDVQICGLKNLTPANLEGKSGNS